MMPSFPALPHAQNDSGGTALWDATTWSNTSPDRLDGVSTTNVADINDYDPDGTTRIGQGLETLGSGETVQIVGSDTITIDNTITGIAASADTNGQSTGMGGTGYAETSGSLSLGASTAGTGTITMTGGRLDVGMANGGIFLQGSGDANAGAIDASVGVHSQRMETTAMFPPTTALTIRNDSDSQRSQTASTTSPTTSMMPPMPMPRDPPEPFFLSTTQGDP